MNKQIRFYARQEIELTWDPRRCIHSAECIHSLPDVFDTDPTRRRTMPALSKGTIMLVHGFWVTPRSLGALDHTL